MDDIPPISPCIFEQTYGVDAASPAGRVGGATGNDGRVFERTGHGVGQRGRGQRKAEKKRPR